MNNGNQKRIDLSLVKEPKVKLRDVDVKSVEFRQLCDTMKEDGLLNPISVQDYVQYSEEEPEKVIFEGYMIVDGLHRLYAARELGWTEIEALVKPQSDAETITLHSMIGNLQRKATKPAEYAKSLRELLRLNPTWGEAGLATRLGVTTEFIQRRLRLERLVPELQKAVDAGDLNLAQAHVLAGLPEAEQATMYESSKGEDAGAFIARVQKRQRELAQEKRGQESAPAVFEPVARCRKLDEVKSAIDDPSTINAFLAVVNASSPQEGAIAALRWAINLDPHSVADQKAEWDTREEEAAKKRALRSTENAQKKAEKARKDLAEAEAILAAKAASEAAA